MTERDWLECTDPERMLNDPFFEPNQRKLRLFLMACYQHVPVLDHDPTRTALEFFEKLQNGSIVEADLQAMVLTDLPSGVPRFPDTFEVEYPRWWGFLRALRCGNVLEATQAVTQLSRLLWIKATDTTAARAAPAGEEARAAREAWAKAESITEAERRYQCQAIREIFGNLFLRITIDPRWLTANVVDLSRTIYDERVFERMPILSDALMDAGCDNEEILNHCRSNAQHVRGCWVIDQLLTPSVVV